MAFNNFSNFGLFTPCREPICKAHREVAQGRHIRAHKGSPPLELELKELEIMPTVEKDAFC